MKVRTDSLKAHVIRGQTQNKATKRITERGLQPHPLACQTISMVAEIFLRHPTTWADLDKYCGMRISVMAADKLLVSRGDIN